jgi:subtilisin family serine protease
MRQATISEPFRTPSERRQVGLPESEDDPGPVVVELNVTFVTGIMGALGRLRMLFDQLQIPIRGDFDLIANFYVRCRLSVAEIRRLVTADQAAPDRKQRAIYRIWPDFKVNPLIDRSVATVKADAARRSFESTGEGITWAVIDSGIDAGHPHFATYDTLGGDAKALHSDFTGGGSPLTDRYGHGTHVAGIIAGGLPGLFPEIARLPDAFQACVGERVSVTDDSEMEHLERRTVDEPWRLSGVAPRTKLVSLKVLDDNGESRSTDVMSALQYVREVANDNGKVMRIHGVNISLGYEFNARWFACGQSPICVEVDRLVKSGVVVVIAAGNTGYGEQTAQDGITSTSIALTINDPGNARLAITVGSTHRDSPHTYGVSYFSSKGPTGDGRLKPDLVAPGERITSCAAGRHREELAPLMKDTWGDTPPAAAPIYVDDTGTSMAAPHVSGAAAAFLSIRQEYIGLPEEVKRIFVASATSLDRDRYFQGAGLVDLMRAIQSV